MVFIFLAYFTQTVHFLSSSFLLKLSLAIKDIMQIYTEVVQIS